MTRLVVVGNGMVGARFVEDLLAADRTGRYRVTVLGAEACEPYNRVLLSEVVGYYAYVVRIEHVPVLRAEEALWTLAAVWIGPLAGAAAFAVRWGRARDRVVALLGFCGVLGGEGAYLAHLAGVPRAGAVEVVVAVVGAAAALVTVPAELRWRVAAGAAGLAVAGGVYLAYAQPLMA